MDRPLERRTAARTAVVWDALRGVLGTGSPEQHVLDVGGGTGGFAVRVASLGHQVVVVDPSPDALAILARRAAEDGVAERVTGVQGDLAGIAGLAPPGGVDVVLCHGVLGLVEDPVAALATIAGVLRPGGVLSLLVHQWHAAVLARAMAGHLVQARALLVGEPLPEERPDRVPDRSTDRSTDRASERVERRFTVEEITDLLDGAGLTPTAVHGVRVFTDLVPSSLLDREPGATLALLELERAVAERSEYLPIAAQVHVLATR